MSSADLEIEIAILKQCLRFSKLHDELTEHLELVEGGKANFNYDLIKHAWKEVDECISDDPRVVERKNKLNVVLNLSTEIKKKLANIIRAKKIFNRRLYEYDEALEIYEEMKVNPDVQIISRWCVTLAENNPELIRYPGYDQFRLKCHALLSKFNLLN